MADALKGVGYGYRGNLHIACWKCGKERSFYTRSEADTFYCSYCGCKTALTDMKKAFVRCECGTFNMYYTNLNEPFEVECRHCNQPIAMYPAKKKGKKMLFVSAYEMELKDEDRKKSSKR